MVGWFHWLNGHEFEQTLRERVKDREAWPAAVHGVAKSRTRQRDWTTTRYSEHKLRYLIYILPWKNSRVCRSRFSYFTHMQLKALRHWIVPSFSFLIFSHVKKHQAVVKNTGLKVKRPWSQFWVCRMISRLVWANYIALCNLWNEENRRTLYWIFLSLSSPHNGWHTINPELNINSVITSKLDSTGNKQQACHFVVMQANFR